MRRDKVAVALGELYSAHFGGKVRGSFDYSKRAYCIEGSRLPACADLAAMYPNGWSLLDYVKPARARRMIADGTVTPREIHMSPNYTQQERKS